MTVPKQSGFFKTTDQTKIYYELYGESGPVVVLTYGIACLMNHWHYQVEEFAKDHQVLMYDIRGHHKSDMGSTDVMTIDLLAQDCIELLDFVFDKTTSASFWGHSFGAPISLRCASLYPDRVSSLVMINGFYKNPFIEMLPTETCLQVIDGLATFAEEAPSFSQWLWSKGTDNLLFHYLAGVTGGFNLERVSYKDIEIYSKGLASIELPYFCRNFRALLEYDGAKYFEQTVCPTLVVHGERDGIVPLDQNNILSECLPNAQFVEFAEGSHCTQLDLPVELNKAVRSFLNQKQLKA